MLSFLYLCVCLSALGTAFAATAEEWKSRSIYQCVLRVPMPPHQLTDTVIQNYR